MFLFVITILLIIIAIPVIRLAYRIWRMQRRMQEFMRDPAGAARREADRAARRQADESGGRSSTSGIFSDLFGGRRRNEPQRRRRRKKIPDNVGEYVRFTEIESKETRQTGNVRFTREEQVQDIDWEDIK